MKTKGVFLSVITPTLNEEEAIQDCIDHVRKILSSSQNIDSYEHIIVDNFSSDNTAKIVLENIEIDNRIKLMVNGRNIGANRSVYKALSKARGEWVIPMLAADLQDPVEVIPKMIDLAVDGVNVVYGVRKNRQEPLIMRGLRAVYYKMIRRFSDVDIPSNVGDFSLIHRSVVQSMIGTEDQYPYIRGQIAQAARKSEYIYYTWVKRTNGKSKSKPLVLIDIAVSGIVSTTQIPARIALIVGFFTSCLGILGGFTYAALTVFGISSAPPGVPTLVVAVFTFMGIQLFFLGLIGEYVLSIHRQIKREPIPESYLERNF